MNEIRDITIALNFLADNDEQRTKSLLEVSRQFDSMGIEPPSNHKIRIILNKIFEDGYVTIYNFNEDEDGISWITAKIYEITFEGLLFIAQGGYANEIAERKRVKSLEDAADVSQSNMVTLTRVLLLVAIVPALLNLLQLLDLYHKSSIPEYWMFVFHLSGGLIGWFLCKTPKVKWRAILKRIRFRLS